MSPKPLPFSCFILLFPAISKPSFICMPPYLLFSLLPSPGRISLGKRCTVPAIRLCQAELCSGKPARSCRGPSLSTVSTSPHYFVFSTSWHPLYSHFSMLPLPLPFPVTPINHLTFYLSPSSATFIIYFIYTPPFSTMVPLK